MGMPRWLTDEVRRLDEPQLRQLLVLARGLLVTAEEPVLQITDVPGMPTVRYRQKPVKCGKATCSRCPHGPYWYAHWVEDGRRRSRYIGAELPPDVRRKLDALDEGRSLDTTEQVEGTAASTEPVASTADGSVQSENSGSHLSLVPPGK